MNPKDLVGAKKVPLRLVPPAAVIEVAEVLALGAKKYGPYNWREYDVQLVTYLEAMLRHIYAVLDGQWVDPESGHPHVAHVGAGAAIVLDAHHQGTLERNEYDGQAAKLLAAFDRTSEPEAETLEQGSSVPVRNPRTLSRMELAEAFAAAGSSTPLRDADTYAVRHPPRTEGEWQRDYYNEVEGP